MSFHGHLQLLPSELLRQIIDRSRTSRCLTLNFDPCRLWPLGMEHLTQPKKISRRVLGIAWDCLRLRNIFWRLSTHTIMYARHWYRSLIRMLSAPWVNDHQCPLRKVTGFVHWQGRSPAVYHPRKTWISWHELGLLDFTKMLLEHENVKRDLFDNFTTFPHSFEKFHAGVLLMFQRQIYRLRQISASSWASTGLPWTQSLTAQAQFLR